MSDGNEVESVSVLSQTAQGQIQTLPQGELFCSQSSNNMEQPPRSSRDRTIK